MLEGILRARRRQLARLERRLAGLWLPEPPPVRDFLGALRAPGLRVIAELKRRSPTAGPIRPGAGPELAAELEAAGAAAISVLTERAHFGGGFGLLRRVRRRCALPLLCKDFVLSPLQVRLARACGADAVLLIVRALGPETLGRLLEETWSLGMRALVEVHDEGELEVALGAGARIIGINNRDLATFRVDPEVTLRLAPRVPADRVVVSESGLRGPEHLRRLAAAGVRAFLIGEALMRAPSPAEALRSLLAAGPR